MTAFLFIASDDESQLARRVDFGNIAGLFGEAYEQPKTRRKRHGTRIAAFLVLLLLAVGDTVLITHPGALEQCFARQASSAPPNTIVRL